MKSRDVAKCAHTVVWDAISNDGLGLLSTVTPDNAPHATWMATMITTSDGALLTLTSEDSAKVSNVKTNPSVEWLFSSEDYQFLVYLKGSAKVISDPKMLKEYWKLIEKKDRAYFLNYCTPGIGFSIVSTDIQSVMLTIPKERKFFEVDLQDFWDPENLDKKKRDEGGKKAVEQVFNR